MVATTTTASIQEDLSDRVATLTLQPLTSSPPKPELPALPSASTKKMPPAAAAAAAIDQQKIMMPPTHDQGPHDDTTLEDAARSRNHLRNCGGSSYRGKAQYNCYGNHSRFQDNLMSQEWRPPGGGRGDVHAPQYFRPPTLPHPPPAPPFYSPSPHYYQPASMNQIRFPADISPYHRYAPPPSPVPPGLYNRAMPCNIPHRVPRGATYRIVVRPASDVRAKLVKQIDYYFCENNLCHDLYLRRNMDEEGWVPLSLVAGFNKVKELTGDVEIILDALRFSSTVQVEGTKIQRRNNWKKWLLEPHLKKGFNTPP